jgi:hypothetical protein
VTARPIIRASSITAASSVPVGGVGGGRGAGVSASARGCGRRPMGCSGLPQCPVWCAACALCSPCDRTTAEGGWLAAPIKRAQVTRQLHTATAARALRRTTTAAGKPLALVFGRRSNRQPAAAAARPGRHPPGWYVSANLFRMARLSATSSWTSVPSPAVPTCGAGRAGGSGQARPGQPRS